MALDLATLKTNLRSAFEVSSTDDVGKARLDAMADAIDAYVRGATVTIAPGAVAVGAMSGGPGVPVTGTGTIT